MACPGLHPPVGARRHDGLETSSRAASVGWGAGIRNEELWPTRKEPVKAGGGLPGASTLPLFPKNTECFFLSRKKFPIPSALSCGFFFVADTSFLYWASFHARRELAP